MQGALTRSCKLACKVNSRIPCNKGGGRSDSQRDLRLGRERGEASAMRRASGAQEGAAAVRPGMFYTDHCYGRLFALAQQDGYAEIGGGGLGHANAGTMFAGRGYGDLVGSAACMSSHLVRAAMGLVASAARSGRSRGRPATIVDEGTREGGLRLSDRIDGCGAQRAPATGHGAP